MFILAWHNLNSHLPAHIYLHANMHLHCAINFNQMNNRTETKACQLLQGGVVSFGTIHILAPWRSTKSVRHTTLSSFFFFRLPLLLIFLFSFSPFPLPLSPPPSGAPFTNRDEEGEPPHHSIDGCSSASTPPAEGGGRPTSQQSLEKKRISSVCHTLGGEGNLSISSIQLHFLTQHNTCVISRLAALEKSCDGSPLHLVLLDEASGQVVGHSKITRVEHHHLDSNNNYRACPALIESGTPPIHLLHLLARTDLPRSLVM